MPYTTSDEHSFTTLNTLHTFLSGIFQPILILQSLLDQQAISTDNPFAAHAEMTRLSTLYTAVLARLSREFGPETANAASEGIQEQLPLDPASTDPNSLIPRYPQLAALLSR